MRNFHYKGCKQICAHLLEISFLCIWKKSGIFYFSSWNMGATHNMYEFHLKCPQTEWGETTAASWKWYAKMDEVIDGRPSITQHVVFASASQEVGSSGLWEVEGAEGERERERWPVLKEEEGAEVSRSAKLYARRMRRQRFCQPRRWKKGARCTAERKGTEREGWAKEGEPEEEGQVRGGKPKERAEEIN